jgi:hypothetical protein
VSVSRRLIGQTVRTVVAIGLVVLSTPRLAQSQVGLTSGLAQVTLVAHVAPRGSIQDVGALQETRSLGTVREASVMVRLSANTGYQLRVSAAGVSTSRIWVRSVTGQFQEITPGSSVTVARDSRRAGEWEREVQYRIESAGDLNSLPVRYEIAINPQL